MKQAEQDPEIEAFRWYSRTKRQNRDRDLCSEIERKLESSSISEERQALYSILALEHQLYERDSDVERTLLAEIREFPDSIRARIQLASHYINFTDDEQKSMAYIESALHYAKEQNVFYREALGNRARLGVKFGRYDILQDSIERILEHGWEKGRTDIGVERDFIDNAPEGSIPGELIDRYNRFCEKIKNRNSD